jgi:hypothetical protein
MVIVALRSPGTDVTHPSVALISRFKIRSLVSGRHVEYSSSRVGYGVVCRSRNLNPDGAVGGMNDVSNSLPHRDMTM